MASKMCVLNEKKICDDCGECDYCDLNPFKICDNCGKCIGMDKEYREIKIDDVLVGNKSKVNNNSNIPLSRTSFTEYLNHSNQHIHTDCDCDCDCDEHYSDNCDCDEHCDCGCDHNHLH